MCERKQMRSTIIFAFVEIVCLTYQCSLHLSVQFFFLGWGKDHWITTDAGDSYTHIVTVGTFVFFLLLSLSLINLLFTNQSMYHVF